jgi:hypothetical protein
MVTGGGGGGGTPTGNTNFTGGAIVAAPYTYQNNAGTGFIPAGASGGGNGGDGYGINLPLYFMLDRIGNLFFSGGAGGGTNGAAGTGGSGGWGGWGSGGGGGGGGVTGGAGGRGGGGFVIIMSG